MAPASGHRFQSEQVHDPLSQALFAQHDVQLAAGGNPLQDFQLPEPHQCRVALQHLGRVGLAAHGCRLLPADDQVGHRRAALVAAAFLASVTLFIRSFMSPGRIGHRPKVGRGCPPR